MSAERTPKRPIRAPVRGERTSRFGPAVNAGEVPARSAPASRHAVGAPAAAVAPRRSIACWKSRPARYEERTSGPDITPE